VLHKARGAAERREHGGCEGHHRRSENNIFLCCCSPAAPLQSHRVSAANIGQHERLHSQDRRLAVRAANCGREQAGELLRVDTMCFEVLRFETNRVLLNVQVHQLCGGESQHCEGEAFGSIWAPNGFRRAQKKATSTRPAPLARLECAGALRAAQHTALCSAALAMAAEVQRYVTPYVYTYISTCTLYVSFSSHS